MGTSGGYPVYEDRDTFYTALADFVVDGDNTRFQDDIVYKDDGEIEASWLRCARATQKCVYPQKQMRLPLFAMLSFGVGVA